LPFKERKGRRKNPPGGKRKTESSHPGAGKGEGRAPQNISRIEGTGLTKNNSWIYANWALSRRDSKIKRSIANSNKRQGVTTNSKSIIPPHEALLKTKDQFQNWRVNSGKGAEIMEDSHNY